MIEKEQQSRIKIIFLFAAIFLIVISFFSYIRINNLIAESKLVSHTEIVKLELEKITAAIIDAETNQKSYLLTGDSSVLASRDASFNTLNLELNLVDTLTRDNPNQIENLKILQVAINLKLMSMKKVLLLYKPQVVTPEFIFNFKEGIHLTQNVKEQINKMQNEEDELLKVRSASFTKSAFITPLFTIVLILGAILILVAAYFKINELNESLNKSRENYRLMVEEVQDYAILYLNREGIIENWNAGAEKIKGYKADEIIGKHFSQFYKDEDRKNNLPQKLLTLATETGKAVQEGWRVRKDGSLFWASIVITAVHNEKKEVIGFSKVTHELTEKKAAEDILKIKSLQLEQNNIELEKKNKELESFNYISSHDLQEPLRQIQNFASRIITDEQQNLSEKGKIYFEKINNSANRMQTLIADLLIYSRTKTEERKFKSTDLNKIVEEVKEDISEELKIKNATIEAIELCECHIIPFQFRQLLQNLISNSLKFSKPTTPPHIKIKTNIAEGIKLKNEKLSPQIKYCHISVSDNGIGFDQQYCERIFEVFQRLHQKTEYNGTGIGLAIVKKIVENHNGIITATSELNQGATFDIYIPASQTN